MDYHDARRLIQTIDLSCFPIPIEIHCQEAQYGSIGITVVLRVQDMSQIEDNPKLRRPMIEIRTTQIIPDSLEEDWFLDCTLRLVSFMVLHELRECFLVNGKQNFEPHEKEKPQ